jgi:hypothetical protein
MDDNNYRSPGNDADRERATAEDILAPKHDDGLCGCCGFSRCYWRRVEFDRGEPLSVTKAALKVVR